MGQYMEAFNTAARKTGGAALLALGLVVGAVSGTAQAQTYDAQGQQTYSQSLFMTQEQQVLQQKPWAADPEFQRRLEDIRERLRLDLERAKESAEGRLAQNRGTSAAQTMQGIGAIIGILGQNNAPGAADDARRAARVLQETGRMGGNRGRAEAQEARSDVQFLRDKQQAVRTAQDAALRLNKEFAEPYLKQAREFDRRQQRSGRTLQDQTGAPGIPTAADVAEVQAAARNASSMAAACEALKKSGQTHPKCK